MRAELASLLFTTIALTTCLGFADAQKKDQLTTHQPELFRVTRDTVNVSIEGRLYSALLVQNKYYAFYHVRDSMSSAPIRKFYIIAKNGQIEKEIKLPKGLLEDTYPKMYYWRGQIYVITEFYKGTYLLLESQGRFEQLPEIVDIPLFENERTAVTSECHGEFGSTIYFKNKSTGIIYSSHAGCPVVVNKVGDNYFINVSGMPYSDIVEIADPVVTNTTAAPKAKVVFEKDDLGADFYIPTSFLVDSTLYLIYNYNHDELGFDDKTERTVVTGDSVKIGTIRDGVFNPVYIFKDKFHIELEQQVTPNYQICTFHTEDRVQIGFKADHPPYMESKYGVIEIADDEIWIHYFISKRQ